MTVSVRTGVTFARAVYLDHRGERHKTAWWARRHMLDDEIHEIRFGFPRWTVLYIERYRLKPGRSIFEGYVIPPSIRCKDLIETQPTDIVDALRFPGRKA